jgi:hypothetical protein
MPISLDGWKPVAGEIKRLVRGETYTLTSTKNITVPNVKITAEDGSGSFPKILHDRRFTNSAGSTIGLPAFSTNAGAGGFVLEKVRFDGATTKNYLVQIVETNGALLNQLNFLRGGGMIEALGSRNLTVQDITQNAQVQRYMMIMHKSSSGKFNENTFVKRFRCPYGSSGEHCFRAHYAKKLTMEDIYLDNTSTQNKKQALNIRNGEDIIIKNFKALGQTIFGPHIGDQDSGSGLRTKNMQLISGIIESRNLVPFNSLEAGIENFLIQDVCIKIALDGGAALQVQADRKVIINGIVVDTLKRATGTLRRVKVTHPQAKFISGRHSGIIFAEGNTINGSPIT